MSKPDTPTAFASATGISVPYASQLLSGSRNPSRPLAIHLLRTTGWKHPVLAELSDEQIDMLEAVEPWAPRNEAAAA